ncbi:MAG: hypothetical protein HY688_03345 [Chloroflexi bacterium]|nr:hypothetical protein [Chloroflexota bacterium]
MPETVILDKVLDGATLWLLETPAPNARLEVLWHRESADGTARTLEGARTLWEVNPDGSDGALKAAFDTALLPANPTLADLFRVVRDHYVLPSI